MAEMRNYFHFNLLAVYELELLFVQNYSYVKNRQLQITIFLHSNKIQSVFCVYVQLIKILMKLI